jgi:hypothetical protein
MTARVSADQLLGSREAANSFTGAGKRHQTLLASIGTLSVERQGKLTLPSSQLSSTNPYFFANKEASLHASNEPLLQHLKVIGYVLIGIIVMDNN